MSKYKIKVIQMGAYVGYLYKKKRWFGWELVENSIHNTMPYHQHILDWQKQYNIPDDRVTFKLTKPPQP